MAEDELLAMRFSERFLKKAHIEIEEAKKIFKNAG